MTPDQYEVIVQDIASKLHEYAGVPADSIRVGKKNKWPGISGYSHQIDVSIEDKKNIILIECKKLGDKVDVPTFLTFLARVLDIYLQESRRGNLREIHSIVVTTVGFDPGVETLAAYYASAIWAANRCTRLARRYALIPLSGPPRNSVPQCCTRQPNSLA